MTARREMQKQVEVNVGFGWGLLLAALILSFFPWMENLEWVPPILTTFELPYPFSGWLNRAALSYIFLFVLIPRYPIGVVLFSIECLTILFTLSSLYGEYKVWRDIIIVYVDEAVAFEPDWIRTSLIMHASYAVGLFVFWLDNWRKPKSVDPSG